MLSVLIPVYNYDIRNLVYFLHNQLEELKIDYEINIVDDCSTNNCQNTNLEIKKLNNTNYFELNKNLGRAKIRNYLASISKYKLLLFLDCDVEIENKNFIKNYLENSGNKVVCGGRIYKDKNKDVNYQLHWLYGTKRELKALRNEVFFSTNFLIQKTIFEQIKFNEKISGYGHEDTIFAIELKNKQIPIIFIDNPCIHVGLDSNENFLAKTEQWIKNTSNIIKFYPEKTINAIKLYKIFFKFKLYKVKFLLIFAYLIIGKMLKKNLLGKKPKIIFLDIYKLLFLAKNFEMLELAKK